MIDVPLAANGQDRMLAHQILDEADRGRVGLVVSATMSALATGRSQTNCPEARARASQKTLVIAVLGS